MNGADQSRQSECQWQRAATDRFGRVLEDQRLRNDICWSSSIPELRRRKVEAGAGDRPFSVWRRLSARAQRRLTSAHFGWVRLNQLPESSRAAPRRRTAAPPACRTDALGPAPRAPRQSSVWITPRPAPPATRPRTAASSSLNIGGAGGEQHARSAGLWSRLSAAHAVHGGVGVPRSRASRCRRPGRGPGRGRRRSRGRAW